MKMRGLVGVFLALGLLAPMTAEAKVSKSGKKAKAASSESYSGASSAGAKQVGSLGVTIVLNAPTGYSNYFPLSLGYQYALSSENSLAFDISYASLGGGVGYSASIMGLDGSYRWWLGEGSGNLHGVYVGPKAYINMISVSYSVAGISGSTSATYFGFGGEGGYQWVMPNNLVFSAGGEGVLPFGLPAGVTMGFTLMAKGSVGLAF